MSRKLQSGLFTAIMAALAAAVLVPIGSAASPLGTKATIPARFAHMQYPGASSRPTVFMAGPIAIPEGLVRTQYPGTSSGPTVLVDVPRSSGGVSLTVRNGQIEIPASLARTQFPGTSSQPTVLVNNVSGSGGGGTFDWVSALIGAGGGLGIAAAGAGCVLAVRRRRTLAHA
jgi:hypothetical protein